MARISVGGGVSDARAVPGQPGYAEPQPEETEAEVDAAMAEGEPVEVVITADTTAAVTALADANAAVTALAEASAAATQEPVSLPGPDLAALPDDSKGGAK